MSIPPPGWGAVEILIWDYYKALIGLGHDVQIVNTPNPSEIIQHVNSGNFDFVHLHYDVFYYLMPLFQCRLKAMTSHYPYIDNPEKHARDGYSRIFENMVSTREYYNFVLADKDVTALVRRGADPTRIHKIKNGIDSAAFQFAETALLDRTIYLGKITPRKRQSKYQRIEAIDFVGNCDDPSFDTSIPNYLGPWSRDQIHANLTQYSNILLMSEGEADPLVIKEALCAGLGVVVNRQSAENVEPTPFITIVEDNDPDIDTKIRENRRISRENRTAIREYGISKYDIHIEVKKYIETIHHIQKQMNPTSTIVTAFFDIGREQRGDGRKLNEYLDWIQKTLKLNCYLYIVTEEKFRTFFEENRPSEYKDKTFIKIIQFSDSHYYRYIDQMRAIVGTPEYKARIAYPNRVECVLPEYNVIQYSKMDYLRMAIEENPFGSEYFFWLDAGASRFFNQIDVSRPFPSSTGVKIIQGSGDRFIAQGRYDLGTYPIDERQFIWTADNLMFGGMFGGKASVVLEMGRLLDETFVKKMLDQGCVNNEQLVLALIWNKSHDKFALCRHMSQPIALLAILGQQS
jgi:hypothetical protein